MYYITKWANCWTLTNDDTNTIKVLSDIEQQIATRLRPELMEKDVRKYFFEYNLFE